LLHSGKDTETVSGEQYFSEDPPNTDARDGYALEVGGRTLRLATTAGTFSARRLDPGTRVLLGVAPAPSATGDLLDVGCGVGPLALAMAVASPAARVWGVDVNPAALEVARLNARTNDVRNATFLRPDEVPADLRFATLWSNPPVRVGKERLHEILRTWIPRLLPEGEAWIVVQRHLGSDSLADWLRAEGHAVERAASRRGYRVLRIAAFRSTTDRPRSAG
jgi:16S rRNA (guanine1207-N2)-methyltransferase